MSFSSFTHLSTSGTFTALDANPHGLSATEVAKRQIKFGPNEITAERVTWWDVLLRQFQSSFVYLLCAAAAISFFLGDRFEAGLMLLFVAINASLGFYQEFKSEQALKLLKKFVESHARVQREGRVQSVSARELVPGDLILIEAGDILPADVRWIVDRDLTLDESALTGESAPSTKTSSAFAEEQNEIYRATNVGFSGTTAVGGTGIGLVIATGAKTEIGNIAQMTADTARASGFEKNLADYSRFILRLVVITLAILFLANLILKGGHANAGELLLFFIALTVSVIPEALPVVTAITLSRGALKLAHNHVVVKRLSAVEDLGSIEILCTDKTGTITENKLTVAEVYGTRQKECVSAATRARTPTTPHHPAPNNAFDLALESFLADRLPDDAGTMTNDEQALDYIPFDPKRRRSSALVQRGPHRELIVRGAPETVVALCERQTMEDRQRLTQWMIEQGKKGRRVIAVAKKILPAGHTHLHPSDEKALEFLGLIAFTDPIKPTTTAAIRQAKALGVRIKILTGDAQDVAAAVAKQIGLVTDADEVVTGDTWTAMTGAEKHAAAERAAVFARVSPEQKHEIIQLLQEKYEVGFLGEGINDAPALKTANVGLAVANASDIARASADIILLEQSLHVVINGITQGRLIFANISKYIKYALTSNFGNFYSIGLAALFIPFLPMLPMQILLENLLSDFPMLAVSTDTADTAELRRPKQYRIREIILLCTWLGLLNSLFDFIFFAIFYRWGAATLQTNWFILNLLTELALIFSLRTRRFFWKGRAPSWPLVGLAIATALVGTILPFSAFGQTIFRFIRPSLPQIGMVILIAAVYFVVTETVKLLYFKRTSARPVLS